MNRREFLASLGVGALSIAGKGVYRPTFCVEIETDGAAIWVNGKRPEKSWVHDDGFYSLDLNFKNLVVAGVTIESIKADSLDCGCEFVVGSGVVMVNNKGTFRGKITKIAEPSQEGKPVTEVELTNGEKLKIEDGKKYLRLDF